MRRNLRAVLALTAAFVLLILALTYQSAYSSVESLRWVGQTRELVATLETLLSRLDEAASAGRGYVITGDEAYLANFDEARSEAFAALARLPQLCADDLGWQGQVAALEPLVRHRLSATEAVVAARREGGLEAGARAVRSGTGERLMVEVRARLEPVREEALARISRQAIRVETLLHRTVVLHLLVGLVLLGLLGGVYALVMSYLRERERAEQDLQALNRVLERRRVEVEAANRELESFSYSVSHDLRAPLRHVSSFVDLLERDAGAALDERGHGHVRTIRAAARRMGALIDDLLAFSRMGRTEMRRQRIDLEGLVHELVGEIGQREPGRKIDWHVSRLPAVGADPAMLRLVLENLLANAVKFTRPRREARIEVGCLEPSGREVSGREAVILVRDNGVGFEMEYATRLFGVFQRLHAAHEFEGTGVGLATVRRVIERHGGRTWAEGELDRGATFYFTLPLTLEVG